MQAKSDLKSIARPARSITASNTRLTIELALGWSDLGYLENPHLTLVTLRVDV